MRILIGVATALVVLPAITWLLVVADVLRVDGGHGLGAWFVESICAAMVSIGALAGGLIGWLVPARRCSALGLAALGAAILIAFLIVRGLPFAR